jgi:SAM-dependent methyltransferase
VLRPDPAEQWERFGREDPYYGVYSIEDFRGRELDAGMRERFFASGEEHVDALFAQLQRYFGPECSPKAVLDYGCGVGRMLIPLARRSGGRAVGVDVSASMLAEARSNLGGAGLGHVELVGVGELDRLSAEFDLVHSAIVLQHVPVREGERIVGVLAGLLRPGGVGAIHVPIAGRGRLRVFNALMKLPLASNLLNLARGRDWSYPHMQMNVYDLGRLVLGLQRRGIHTIHVAVAPPYGGYHSCTL